MDENVCKDKYAHYLFSACHTFSSPIRVCVWVLLLVAGHINRLQWNYNTIFYYQPASVAERS